MVKVLADDGSVVYSENTSCDLLADGFYAEQFVERIGWALQDAEEAERDAHRLRLADEPVSEQSFETDEAAREAVFA